MNEIINDASSKMDKNIDAFKSELAKIRTGKASTILLEGVKVDYYGNSTPLSQVGNVTVMDSHTLNITPWDKSMVQAIEKAIMNADLGLNPSNDGANIRVPIPPLTEERRREYVKLVKKYGEDYKVGIRNLRREANDNLKKLEKNKEISEDSRKDAEDRIQKLTDKHISRIDELVKNKETEIMEI